MTVAAGPPPVTPGMVSLPRPRPIKWLGFLATIGLIACAVLALLGMIVEAQYHRAIARAIANGSLAIDAPQVEHHRHVVTEIALPVWLATAFLFLVWFHRAYANLGRLGVSQLRWAPGWSIGAWFVPILNLFRPKALADDIWRGSDPGLPLETRLPEKRAPLTFAVWWTSLILGIGLAIGSAACHRYATTLTTLKTGSALEVGSWLALALAALFAIVVVWEIGVRQTARVRAFELGVLPGKPGRPRPRNAEELEAMRTPGGRMCTACGFESHPMAVSCVACHKRF